MKKVYLIGDCHSARVSEHWNPEDCKVDFKVWGKAGEFAWKFDPKKLKDNVFNLNDLKFETIKKEITLFHLKADDKRLNEPINLKIKNK